MEDIYAKVSRRLLQPLLLAYIIAYLDRVNVGFAKLQMLGALHFSETIYGLGAGIFFVGYFLFGVPSNLILHRFGARLWMAKETGLTREGLYRALSGEGNPSLGTVLKVLKALGLKFMPQVA